MFRNQIEKPVRRGALRTFLGREWFIAKRKVRWLLGSDRFARIDGTVNPPFSVFKHQSMLLRPLKDVDMVLQYNKVENLRLAIRHLNGAVIKPGEVLSVWQKVGRPTKRKGYKRGLVLHNGQTFSGTGGGLCQLGNLLYWIFLHSPLTIKERWRHGFDVFPDVNRTIPFACGATLSYNYIDLQVKNETDRTFRINLWLDDTHLHGELFCSEIPENEYEIFETDHLIQQQWWGGYSRHNRIWKKITNKTTQAETVELVAENHAIMMYNPMIEKH